MDGNFQLEEKYCEKAQLPIGIRTQDFKKALLDVLPLKPHILTSDVLGHVAVAQSVERPSKAPVWCNSTDMGRTRRWENHSSAISCNSEIRALFR